VARQVVNHEEHKGHKEGKTSSRIASAFSFWIQSHGLLSCVWNVSWFIRLQLITMEGGLRGSLARAFSTVFPLGASFAT
jgi:hypothetical protein